MDILSVYRQHNESIVRHTRRRRESGGSQLDCRGKRDAHPACDTFVDHLVKHCAIPLCSTVDPLKRRENGQSQTGSPYASKTRIARQLTRLSFPMRGFDVMSLKATQVRRKAAERQGSNRKHGFKPYLY